MSQTIVNPVFDRTDHPELHVDKIEVTEDSTFVYCTYLAEAGSWANISSNTYIEDIATKKKYTIIKSKGIPLSPAVREFNSNTLTTSPVLFVFPSIGNTTLINFVENPDKKAFNIYGINLQKTFDYTYNYDDISFYGESVVLRLNAIKGRDASNSEKDSTLIYLQKQLEASNYWHGTRSEYSAYATFNYELYYSKTSNLTKTIEWGEQAIGILRDQPKDSIIIDVLARAYTTLGTAYAMKQQIETGLQYYELSLAIKRTHEGAGVISYEELLGEMSRLYHYIGNHPKALFYGEELADFYKTKYEENRNKYQCVYINALNNLCEYQRMMSKHEDALETGKRALALFEHSDGECDYALWLKYFIYNNLGLVLLDKGQIDEAKSFFEMIVQDTDTLQLEHKSIVLNSRMLLADIYLETQKDTLGAIREYESIKNLLEEDSELDITMYTGVLSSLYNIYENKDYNKSLEYLRKNIHIIKEAYGEESVAYARLLAEYISRTWLLSEIGENDTLYSN